MKTKHGDWRDGVHSAPGPGETVAVTIDRPKSSALCYDRVWDPFQAGTAEPVLVGNGMLGAIPSGIGACWASPAERDLSTLLLALNGPKPAMVGLRGTANKIWFDLTGDSRSEGDQPKPSGVVLDRRSAALYLGLAQPTQLPAPGEPLISLPEDPRALTPSLNHIVSSATGIATIPVFGSVADGDRAYEQGAYEIVVRLLENLAVVDEGRLTWEQVLDFRQDRTRRTNYVRLVHWLDASMVGRSATFIEHEVGLMLDAYRTALREAGLPTRNGTLAVLLDPKWFMTATTAAVGAASLVDSWIAALPAASFLLSGVGLHVVKKRAAESDVRSGKNAPVALIHEIAKQTAS